MKKSIYALLVFAGVSTFVGCSSDDNSNGNLQNDTDKFVQKMVVKSFNGQAEPQITGTFDFSYDSNMEVTSILKSVTSETGDVVENQIYAYVYNGDKIVSYQIANMTANSVTYEGNRIKNLGFGSDLEYTSSGLLHKDSYGIEYVYQASNPTGTSTNPNLYTYDNKVNPFYWHNPFFRIIFEEQFEAYYSTDFFRAENNLVSETGNASTMVREFEYNSDNMPTKITTKIAGTNEILEEITYEYTNP